jgi:hypothetical protein
MRRSYGIVEEQSRLGIGTQGGKEAMARWVVRLALKGHINHASELVFLEKKPYISI